MVTNNIKYFSSNAGIFGTLDLENRIKDKSIRAVGLAEAIITGQAPDGGLFMPTHFPSIPVDEIMQMKNMDYSQVFTKTMEGYFEDVLSKSTLERIAKEAYNFPTIIEPISDKDYLLRLDNGPTAAFKDYAAQVLFRVVEALMKEKPSTEIKFREQLSDIKLLTYITATSGDTGAAMGHACLNKDKMWMAILHSSDIPKEISDLQAKQMDTLGDNIYVIRTDTPFDGNQKIAQELQKDENLRYMNMSSANSINIGRLLPQMAYYFYSYAKVAQKLGEEIYMSVPSGNFGDAVAGLFAKKMGLPIKLIIGVNENDVFERYYRTGNYEPASESKISPSNAMNVNWPSNMRRLFQLYSGQFIEGKDPGDGRKVISNLVPPNLRELRNDISAFSISDDETHDIVAKFYRENHMIEDLHSTIEPHGAVAWGSTQKFREENDYKGKIITLETAHPGKFPESLKKIDIEPELPDCLAKLVDAPHGRFYTVKNGYEGVKALVIELHNQELKKYK